ncbi:MAG: cytochrome c biogenesis protein CcdA [Clostridia bacterium]|nr:cytochrome c biogenesis protein CcdA [Clostridia bacterium]
MGNSVYLLTFLEGILAFISPCILPLLPVYFIYLAGVSTDKGGESSLDRSRLIVNSIGFIIGFSIVLVLLGATASSIGQFLEGRKDILRKLGGIIMVVFGLNFLGILKLNFLNFEKRINYNFTELKLVNSIVFGMIFVLGWTPCSGAYLASALAMASNSSSIFQGMLLLLLYAMGLGVPFLLSAIFFDKLRNVFKQIQRYNRIIGIISGIVLIAVGILFFFNKLNYLAIIVPKW